MTGIIRAILYRVLDEPRDRAACERALREREVAALEKLAKATEARK